MESIRLISSQTSIDNAVVARKIKSADHYVLISPSFLIDGVIAAVILDGHHAYAAAQQAGVQPQLQIYSGLPDNIDVQRKFYSSMMYSTSYKWGDTGAVIKHEHLPAALQPSTS